MSRTPKSTSSDHEGEQRARSNMTFSVFAHGVRIASKGYVSSSIAALGIPISADIDLKEGRERLQLVWYTQYGLKRTPRISD